MLEVQIQTSRCCLASQVVFHLIGSAGVQPHVTIPYTWLCDHVIVMNTVQYSKGHLHVFNVFVYCNKDYNIRSFHRLLLMFTSHVLILEIDKLEEFL